jgi:CheY-like chemotaxis protein
MADDGVAKPRVLVVEDEAIVAMHLERVLERAGWEVVGPAAHQLAALRLAWREPLDAALLDLDLRGESGAPVAEALVARGVPVVVLSGSRRGLLTGAPGGVSRLDKPYRPEGVLRALASAVLARAA